MNTGLGYYYFSKDWIRTHLVIEDDLWCIDYKGHESEGQVRDLFGTTIIPTVWGKSYSVSYVIEKLYVSMNRKGE